MSDLNRRKAELEARKAKLRELQQKKQEDQKTVPNILETDNLASKIIQDREKEQQKQLEVQEEQKANEQQKSFEKYLEEKRSKLSMESYVGEVTVSTYEKVYIDQEVQHTPDLGIVQQSAEKKRQDDDDLALPAKHYGDYNKLRSESKQFQPIQEISNQENQDELTEEDIKTIIKSGDFVNFFNKTTKIVEKSLEAKDVELIEDKFEEMVDNDDDYDQNDPLHHEKKFFDPQFCANRVVTVLQQSPNIPELFLAGYSQNDQGNINDQVGVVLLWSQTLRNRPEFHCFCQSQVTSACFYPYNNNVIIGGCYNGQILIWDLRANSIPAQRSNQDGHVYPVYSLNVVGTQHAHNIVSICNQGTICTWDMNMLDKPQKQQKLQYKTGENLNEANVTCMDFAKGESNNFNIGCEDGTIHKSMLHSADSNIIQQSYTLGENNGHSAPITAISQSTISDNSTYLQNLVLSSSFDWSVKLWNFSSEQQECIYTFESSEDYVYDVKWNTQNPSMFATADGEGQVHLFDLQSDLEMPVGKHQNQQKESINKIAWNQTGDKIFTGDAKGSVDLYGIQKKFLKFDESKVSEIEALLQQNIIEN